MRRLRRFTGLSCLGLMALALLAVPGEATGTSDGSGSTANAVLKDANGAVVARVGLVSTRGSVAITVRATGQTAGFHGFHVHAVGECVAPFTTAGGHLNPGGGTHGDHAGDLPSLLVQANGVTSSAVQTDRFTLSSLFDADGSAFILHADRDNFGHIPTRYVSSTTGLPGPDAATLATGDAGARVACGVITR